MDRNDYIVLLIYLVGIFLVGVFFARKNKSSEDMFSAGGRSPWWTSGLSAFMTMFSANTFVVWGGIGYRLGFVAVLINLMYGVAALLVGYFAAGRWKAMGIKTPAEFVQERYGSGALHFYTWFMTVFRMLATAGALYAMGRILVTLMPLEEGHFLRDAVTGNLSLMWAIVILSSVVVIYTMLGGLWAVLMTDVLQFIVLNLAVVFMIPLILMEVGGTSAAIEGLGAVTVDDAGNSMLSPLAGDYSLMFLAGWCAIHFFMIGAEWAFVQRFICVPDPKSARKSTYLFGLLYLGSPMLWLLPPILYRLLDPIPEGLPAELFQYVPLEKRAEFDPAIINACVAGNADTIPAEAYDKLRETAVKFKSEAGYIAACERVLPSGMLGLMFAAMFSATASMVSSQLNVFSGVMTNDIVKPLMRKAASPQTMLWIGRLFTVILGVVLIVIATLYQKMGGAEQVIVKSTEAVVAALLAPMVWGLFSRRINTAAVWWTAGVGMIAGVSVRLGLAEGGFMTDIAAFEDAAQWVQDNMKIAETLSGVVLPVLVLVIVQLLSKGTSKGYERIVALQQEEAAQEATGRVKASRLPAIMVGWSVAMCGFLMMGLVFVNDEDRGILAGFGVAMFVIAAAILGLSYRVRARRDN